MSNNMDPSTSPVDEVFAKVVDVINRAPPRMAKDAKKRKLFSENYLERLENERRMSEEDFGKRTRQRAELFEKYTENLKEVFRADMAYNRVGPILSDDAMTLLENKFVEGITKSFLSLSVSKTNM